MTRNKTIGKFKLKPNYFPQQSHLDNWVKVASLNKGRWRHRMITMGGHVYAIGGYDGKKVLKSVERYDRFDFELEFIIPI